MSRYPITVKSELQTEENAVIGFDPPLRTYFLQAFPDEATDACALWLGGFLRSIRALNRSSMQLAPRVMMFTD